jgi:hypothetical protein
LNKKERKKEKPQEYAVPLESIARACTFPHAIFKILFPSGTTDDVLTITGYLLSALVPSPFFQTIKIKNISNYYLKN